jgi:Kef-type K+ transport system membrane component KefB
MPVFLAANVESAKILFALFVMIASAKLLAELFERMKQPAVVGEILAGVIIGPGVLRIVEPSATLDIIAEIGVIFLLFNVGLETKPQDVLRVGKHALLVAVLGVVVPFIAGYLISVGWGGSTVESMFLGAAMVATSVGITARVLGSLGLLDREAARIILGAAVIDDILGLIVLSVVSSFSKGSVDYLTLAGTAGLAVAFTVMMATVGAKLVNKLAPRIKALRISKPFFNAGLILCLGLSFAAVYIGVAAIIGAFLAGMALAEATEDNPKMHKLSNGVMEFLVPFFLVNIGMQLNLSVFGDFSAVAFALVVTAAAVATKIVGCGLGALGTGRRQAVQVGVGMIPRGEVGIVVAQIGLSLAAIGDMYFGAVLFMAISTTLIAPPLIKWIFAEDRDGDGEPDRMKEVHLSDVFSRIG